jgi:hypothetical protein
MGETMEKQGELPGQESERIEDIESSAEAYHDKVRERLEIQKEEADLYAQLAAAMKKHKKKFYRIVGTDLAVTCEESEKFKVNKVKKPKEE